MNSAQRAQFNAMKDLHTPSAEFVSSLEARIQEAPATGATSEHFPAQLRAVVDRAIQSIVPQQFVAVAHRVTTVLLVSGVAVGGWIATVSASYNAVPGDALYNVKLATERVQLVAVEATGDKTKTAKLHTEFAERRANEVKKVIEKNKEPEQARTAMALLTKSVNDASEAVKAAHADPATSESAIASTEELLEDTERIAASLREVLVTLPPNVAVLIDEIVVVHGELTDKRLSTLQDIVRQQIDGQSGLTIEETRAIVVRALEEISDSTEETATLAKQVEETKRQLEEEAATEETIAEEETVVAPEAEPTEEVATDTIPVAASTTSGTPALELGEVQEPVQPELANIEQISDELVAETEAVERLVEEGNLLEALEQAKAINTRQVEIEKVVKKEALETGVSLEEPAPDVEEETTPEETQTTPSIDVTPDPVVSTTAAVDETSSLQIEQ